VEATGPYEVVFNLCSPDPAFLAKMAFVPFGIQSSEHLESTNGSPLENPIGTGPFQVDAWDRGSEILFSRNESYWGDAPAFDTLVFRWAAESTSRILELESGNADLITNLAASDYETIEANADLQVLPDLNPNVFYVGFTNTHAPFDDERVRQAIALGIDRQRIVDTFYPEGSEVASHFTPCSIPNGCEGDAWWDFDPEAGRALLAEAGFEDGFETTIYLRDVFRVYLPEPQVVATEIQTQLSENLGIEAEIEVQESGAFIESVSAGDITGIHLLGWGADYPHVTNFLDYHFGGNLQFGDTYEDIASVLTEAAATVDVAAAAPLYEQANNLIREHVPMVPIAHGAAADASLASLGNANVPPLGAPQFALMDPGKDTLVFVQNAEPISLYCSDETDGESLSACEQVMEGLYGYDLEGLPQPKLAESCDPNDDGTMWTCTLREGVTFHDGTDFDSADVVATWAAGLDAANPLHTGNTGLFEYYAYLWGGLINAEG
jgi:ABC-type transport system substrate-binding protein